MQTNIWQVKKGVPPFTQEGYEVTNGIESYWFKTKDWAWDCKLHFERLDIAACTNVISITGGTYGVTPNYKFYSPAQSDWKCYLFGSESGITFIPPNDDKVPNWFWRKMQHLILGFVWTKNG